MAPAAREGVPAFLEPALRSWIFETASLDPDEAEHALIRLGLVLPESYWQRYERELKAAEAEQARLDAQRKAKLDGRPKPQPGTTAYLVPSYEPRQFTPSPPDPHARFLAEGTAPAILLDVADDLLHALCTEPLPPGTPRLTAFRKYPDVKRTKQITSPLRRLLEESRSVYEIRPDQRGLRRRIDVFLADAAERAGVIAEASGRPKAHAYLIRAQDRLFDLHPDPSGAYVDAIRAVEAVAIPLFLPNDQVPTLGKVRKHLSDAGGKYEYVIPDKTGAPGSTAGVVAMLTDLWDGHSDRHAGGPLSVPVIREAAEAAFTLAVSLVTLFSTGAVRPSPRTARASAATAAAVVTPGPSQ